ncbi:MAG: hypothetical protein ACOX3R_11040 [Desulfitobacteriia bacterium]
MPRIITFEKEYIYYIAEIENMFKLEPYELLALIAQESKFVPPN